MYIGTALVIDLLIPLVTVLFGWLLWKHPPAEINGVYGYRTARSMRSPDTWMFAQTFCGRLWWKLGWGMLLLSAAVHLPFWHSAEQTVSALCLTLCLLQAAALVASVVPVERALRRTFPEDGTRRSEDESA